MDDITDKSDIKEELPVPAPVPDPSSLNVVDLGAARIRKSLDRARLTASNSSGKLFISHRTGKVYGVRPGSQSKSSKILTKEEMAQERARANQQVLRDYNMRPKGSSNGVQKVVSMVAPEAKVIQASEKFSNRGSSSDSSGNLKDD